MNYNNIIDYVYSLFCLTITGMVDLNNPVYDFTFSFADYPDITYNQIKLEFPFNNQNGINLQKEHSNIIMTMCKNYSHRLDEWINYNLKLGFTEIIIFNNDNNISNGLNEQVGNNCIMEKSMYEIAEKYSGRVLLIDFPYSPLSNFHYNTIQNASLSIGINALKTKCKYIAMIDADEFIYLPKNPYEPIGEFLDRQNNTITM
jgi:hypothetical protein